MERIVEVVDYSKFSKEIENVRNEVFVKEQKIAKELEFDGEDEKCCHILIFVENKERESIPVATGRVLKDGHIGRVAVLESYRKRGLGSKIMLALEKIAKDVHKSKEVFLGAQESAVKFYEKIGYSVSGPMFIEADIPHFPMKKELV